RRGEEHEARLGQGLADLPGAGQVDLQQHGAAFGDLLLDGPARGAVLVAAVHHGPLEHLAALDEGGELLLAHEAVVHPVDLAGPRGPSGRGDGQPDLGIAGADRCGDGALAHGGGPGQNGDRGRRLLGAGPGGGIAHSAKCATSFSAWWEPRPRILREGEMPISSMICCALTLPTPGSASSSAETRRRPTISLVSASLRTFLISSPR